MDEEKRVKNQVILGAQVCVHIHAELHQEQELRLDCLENEY